MGCRLAEDAWREPRSAEELGQAADGERAHVGEIRVAERAQRGERVRGVNDDDAARAQRRAHGVHDRHERVVVEVLEDVEGEDAVEAFVPGGEPGNGVATAHVGEPEALARVGHLLLAHVDAFAARVARFRESAGPLVRQDEDVRTLVDREGFQ